MAERSDSAARGARRVPPPEAFRASARVGSPEAYRELHRRSLEQPEAFWEAVAGELHWFERWERVLSWDEPYARWFEGGTTNLSYNCLDLQVERGRGDKPALLWEGEPGDRRSLSYRELLAEVERFANVLRAQGVDAGDSVVLYMPVIPEAAVAMLACARIGAPHTVVFAGFSAQALAERIVDVDARLVVTADGGHRRGRVLPLKAAVDEALQRCPSVTSVVTVRRAGNPVTMAEGRDVWYHQAMEEVGPHCPAVPLEAEHPLFVLHTSSATGGPKGVVHTTGGYQTYAYLTTRLVFDLQEEDVYWCSADLGWITGHSYVLYGPLSNGASVVMVEGPPTHPSPERFGAVIERHGVTILYTTPTAIRALRSLGEAPLAGHDIGSLRLLGTVGEPIGSDAWLWFWREVGGERCPVVDTWWQTETGGIMIATLPGAHDAKPGAAGVAMPGIDAAVVDLEGNAMPAGEGGYLVVRHPWPGMLRTLANDDDRYRQQYWGEIPHAYFTGDGARRDDEGYFWIMGRVDDVVNVSGHRLGTMEVEAALVSHPAVAEAAVVGRPDELRGQAIVAYVTLEPGAARADDLPAELAAHVTRAIGPIARPDEVSIVGALPRTRSGKIMRRLLRDRAAQRASAGPRAADGAASDGAGAGGDRGEGE